MQRSKSTLALILLTALIGTESIFYLGLQDRYDKTRSNYAVLQNLFAELNSSHDLLNTSYQGLVLQHTSLQSSYDSLTQSYASLYGNYTVLDGDYQDLQNANYELQIAHEAEKALRIGNSLESYYDRLRAEKGPREWWSQQREVDFCASLAMHDLDRFSWPLLEDEYYDASGEYSCESAKTKIDQVVDIIDTSADDSPTEKIRKILDFIDDHIFYEAEIDDVYLAPVETLGFKSGDCEDYSILAAALFEAVEIDAAVGFFRNDADEYHAMVLVHLEGLTDYLHFHCSDLTGKGLEEGKWIIIEPQSTISHQFDEWIKQWSLIVVAPLD